VLAAAQVAAVVDAIVKAAKTGKIDDGEIFVSPVESVLRIRIWKNWRASGLI
jgi:nitrogen regulatory protein P-II 1